MFDRTIHLEPNQVPAALRGGYTGKHFKVNVTESVTVPSHAGLWDGGSRDTYKLVHLETGEGVAASDNMSAPWDPRHDRKIVLQAGFAVIRHTIFCGKDLGLTFYVHPENAAKLLPAPAAELTDVERMVLNATIQFKASYGGRDRYQMATDDLRWSNPPKVAPTRDAWNAAKESLISKGLLNKAGAVTVAGRNART